MLEIKDLCYAYPAQSSILDSVSMIAMPGDIVWIQGENGCGKSTLLKIISQLIEASGSIRYYDSGIYEGSDILSFLSYIPSDPYLFDYLTGYENAIFFKELFKLPSEQFEKKLEMVIQALGMNSHLHKYVQDYSLGMRHKLFWASTFSRKTPIYLLDEPFSSFDPQGQKVAYDMLKESALEGAIILFASHLTICQNLATRNYRLEGGKLEEVKI